MESKEFFTSCLTSVSKLKTQGHKWYHVSWYVLNCRMSCVNLKKDTLALWYVSGKISAIETRQTPQKNYWKELAI